jgi:hypothetical protein
LLLGSETEEDGMKDEDNMAEKKNEMWVGRSGKRFDREGTEEERRGHREKDTKEKKTKEKKTKEKKTQEAGLKGQRYREE